MIVKQTDMYGRVFYANILTREVYKPMRVRGRAESKLPNHVYGHYRKPQPRGTNKVENIIKNATLMYYDTRNK